MVSRIHSPAWNRRASDAPIARHPILCRDPALEELIADGRIEVRFQPQFRVGDGQIIGVEALARGAGSAPAPQLFARAANSGLTERLSRSVQRRALRTAAKWTGALAGLKLSINALAEEVSRPGYDRWLLEETRLAGIAPERIMLEITESALIADQGAAATRLSRLRAAGVAIAIDDFGTGYASLAYLTSLPLDLLKIDRSLVLSATHSARARVVIRSTIRLARDLGLEVLVEGVESEDQLLLLRQWECDYYQGFLRAGALSEDALSAFVTGGRRAAA